MFYVQVHVTCILHVFCILFVYKFYSSFMLKIIVVLLRLLLFGLVLFLHNRFCLCSFVYSVLVNKQLKTMSDINMGKYCYMFMAFFLSNENIQATFVQLPHCCFKLMSGHLQILST